MYEMSRDERYDWNTRSRPAYSSEYENRPFALPADGWEVERLSAGSTTVPETNGSLRAFASQSAHAVLQALQSAARSDTAHGTASAGNSATGAK